MRVAVWLLAGVLAGCAQPQTARQYGEAYHQPLISPGTRFLQLPPAVQHTVGAEAGAAEIFDIMNYTNAGRVVYRISFVKDDQLPPLFVAQDGSVLYPDLTVAIAAPESAAVPGGATGRLSLKDLPPQVVKVIEERAPHTQPATIEKAPYGNQTVYVITFKDPSQPRLYINPDGTVLAEGMK